MKKLSIDFKSDKCVCELLLSLRVLVEIGSWRDRNLKPSQIFNFFPNHPPPDHNLWAKFSNYDLASYQFPFNTPLGAKLGLCQLIWTNLEKIMLRQRPNLE